MSNSAGWISANERSPDINVVVLCYTDDDSTIVGFFDGEWCSGNWSVSWDYCVNHDVKITHWMPLPEAPTV